MPPAAPSRALVAPRPDPSAARPVPRSLGGSPVPWRPRAPGPAPLWLARALAASCTRALVASRTRAPLPRWLALAPGNPARPHTSAAHPCLGCPERPGSPHAPAAPRPTPRALARPHGPSSPVARARRSCPLPRRGSRAPGARRAFPRA
jgi:hypothetical protein